MTKPDATAQSNAKVPALSSKISLRSIEGLG